jgi:hypothetical protein
VLNPVANDVVVVWVVSLVVAKVVVNDVDVVKDVVRLVVNIASHTVTGVWLALLAMT